MKTLSALETTAVSGGDTDMTIQMFVPTASTSYVGGVFQALIGGQMGSTADFIAALQDPAVQTAFNNVRITSIEFAGFN